MRYRMEKRGFVGNGSCSRVKVPSLQPRAESSSQLWVYIIQKYNVKLMGKKLNKA